MTERLAMSGGTPVRTKAWPKWPIHDQTEEQALLDVLRSGTWGVGGKRVVELEQKYAAAHRAKYGIACCNGTIALQVAMVAAGVQPGDEVITTPYTFMASALAALTVGAIPVFVDVEPGTHNIDPDLIEAAITPRTTAILPVHIGGRPSDMDRLLAIAHKRKLLLLEDACQAWLAEWKGTPVGAIGDAGGFSFQSSKNMAAGEGGMIVTNDQRLFERAWSYHNCGRTLGGEWYTHDYPGLNYRLSEFQGAVLLAQFARLPEMQRRRSAAMAVLQTELAKIPGILVPDKDDRITAHGCHIFMVRLDKREIGVDKQSFIKALNAEGIPAAPGYTTSMHRQNFWTWYGDRPTGAGKPWKELFPRPYDQYQLPVCDELCKTTIWIKQDALMAGPEEMADVVAAFQKVAHAARAGQLVGA